jgi:hypothetical protein
MAGEIAEITEVIARGFTCGIKHLNARVAYPVESWLYYSQIAGILDWLDHLHFAHGPAGIHGFYSHDSRR